MVNSIGDEEIFLTLLVRGREGARVLTAFIARFLSDLLLVLDQDVFHGTCKFVLLLEIALQLLLELLLFASLALFFCLCVDFSSLRQLFIDQLVLLFIINLVAIGGRPFILPS